MMTRFQSLFSRLTIRRQLTLLTLLFVAGVLLFSFLAFDTLTATKVNGPYYDRIIQGKDLIADVLPPPEYIIESQLLVLQMLQTSDPAQLPPLMQTFDRLEREYSDRHEMWVSILEEGELKDMMMVHAFEPARRFFMTARRDLFPLLLSGQRADAEDLVKGVLSDCYQQHRGCIDNVVEMAKVRITQDEQAARRVIANRTLLLITLGSILALLVAFSSELLGRRIAARLDETVRVLDAVAAGDLTHRLQTHGQDEITQMGTALNQAITTSRRNLMAARRAEQTIRELNADLEQHVAQRTRAFLESEQRLRVILETAVDAIITVDGAGIIESVNPAAEQMFGYSIAEMIGQNIKMLVPSPHREAHDGYLAKLSQTGAVLPVGLRREVIGQRKDGIIFSAELAISSANLPDRQQFTGIVRDITRRKKYEAELAQAKEVAEAANNAKSSFLASMSHELRTPLNGILGMNELLLGTALTDRQREFITASRISGKLLLQLINDVLDLSKIEAGKLDLDLRECQIETLIYDVVDALGHGAKQKGLVLHASVDPAVCVTVLGDDNRLRQILVNLIGNGIKFTTSGSVTVRAECRERAGTKISVRFNVTDTGVGIPEAQRERLFQPFIQVDSSTARNFGGTGLGLAICKQLIELMQGEFGIDSIVGRGSTFWFEVPLELVRTNAEMTDLATTIAGARVLVVADDLPNRTQILDSLRDWGCSVESVGTHGDALQSVSRSQEANRPFDSVLVGLLADSATKYELIDALTRRYDLPVIGFGDIPNESDSELLRQIGIRHLLRQPVRPSALFDALASTLTNSTSHPKPDATADVASGNDLEKLCGHVLVAEDNRINQMYIVELLKYCGCTCDLACNGDEALDAVQRQRYDLVLMDCQMPEMDGFTAVREIRRREAGDLLPGRLPIIALTANALKGDRQLCLDAGMDDYLTKPIEAANLRNMLLKFLNDRSPPESPPINFPVLIEGCLGNVEFAMSLLDEFERSGPEAVESITTQVSQANLPATAELAHSLKGTAGILAATNLREITSQLETAAKFDDLTATWEFVSQLRAEMSRCLDALPALRTQKSDLPISV